MRAWCQGRELQVARLRLGERIRTVARWPRLGAGRYRLRCQVGDRSVQKDVRIAPAKLSPPAFAQLLEDLEGRLPASIVIRIREMGGLTGLDHLRLEDQTIDQEILALTRAVQGSDERPGLAAVLRRLASDHHAVLGTVERWVRRERARRPSPERLSAALIRGQNLDFDSSREPPTLPKRVIDTRVRHTADVYENRIVASFSHEVGLRLQRLGRVLSHGKPGQRLDRVAGLVREWAGARRHASFLDDVSLLDRPPDRITMVLLKRPVYRAAMAGYQELHRIPRVRYEDPRLAAPLWNVPALYQVWGSLVILDVLLELGESLGYHLVRWRLLSRSRNSVFVRLIPDGRSALVLRDPARGTKIEAIPERSYRPDRTGLRSATFTQRPDLAIELSDESGTRRVILFDPKYKLWSEDDADGEFTGSPMKADTDKMHAYRDAIRDERGRSVVRHASILYPGETRHYPGVSALRSVPGEEDALREELSDLLRHQLG